MVIAPAGDRVTIATADGSPGLLVNGLPVSKARLRDGETFTAGGVSFAVRLEGYAGVRGGEANSPGLGASAVAADDTIVKSVDESTHQPTEPLAAIPAARRHSAWLGLLASAAVALVGATTFAFVTRQLGGNAPSESVMIAETVPDPLGQQYLRGLETASGIRHVGDARLRADVPRPAGSFIRALESTHAQLTDWQVHSEPEQALLAYERQLTSAGFVRFLSPSVAGSGREFRKGTLTVFISASSIDGRTLLEVIAYRNDE